jgi:hypothetical protein
MQQEPPNVTVPQRRASAWLWWGGAIALGVAIAIAMVLIRQRIADPTPPLTSERFDAAWERWRSKGPGDYEIQVRVTGSQPATYRVLVGDGEAQEAFRNGQPLQQHRTFETWSVPGMFSTIEADLTRQQGKASAGVSPARMTLRAEFDPEFGYPRKYRRIEWGQGIEVHWEVEKFEPR